MFASRVIVEGQCHYHQRNAELPYYLGSLILHQDDGKLNIIDGQHYKQLILEYIEKFGSARRSDINGLLLDKLPDVLDGK